MHAQGIRFRPALFRVLAAGPLQKERKCPGFLAARTLGDRRALFALFPPGAPGTSSETADLVHICCTRLEVMLRGSWRAEPDAASVCAWKQLVHARSRGRARFSIAAIDMQRSPRCCESYIRYARAPHYTRNTVTTPEL